MIIKEYRRPYSWTNQVTGKKTTVNVPMVELVCDQCQVEHTRVKKHYNKMQTNANFTKDFCNRCWQSLQNNLPERRQKNSEAQTRRYTNYQERKRTSESMKGKVNLGKNNAMTRPEIRKKVSVTRTALMQDSTFRKKFVQGSIDAWRRGSYNVVNDANCKCKWYTYIHSSGKEYRVQGTWELKFIEWLDQNNLTFDCHKGRLDYVDDHGIKRSYYPDFFVYEWNSYIDPKADHWYKKQYRKFELLNEQHPDKNIQVLTKQKLTDLGIQL
jgi:hypothetical protein